MGKKYDITIVIISSKKICDYCPDSTLTSFRTIITVVFNHLNTVLQEIHTIKEKHTKTREFSSLILYYVLKYYINKIVMCTHLPMGEKLFLENYMSKRYYSQLIEEQYSCPLCNSKEIQLDDSRSEIYCSECGLVISSPSDEGVLPYDYGEQPNVATSQQADITNYRHSYTNTQLMKHGLRRK